MWMRPGWLIVQGLLTIVNPSPCQEPTEARTTVKVLTAQAERQAKLLRRTMAELRKAQAHLQDPKDDPAQDSEVDRRVRADPEIAALRVERDRFQKQLLVIRRVVRTPRDPVLVQFQTRSEQLANRYETLRAEKELLIREQLQNDDKANHRLDRALDRLATEMERWQRERPTSGPQP